MSQEALRRIAANKKSKKKKLDLMGSNLEGPLPWEIAELTWLEILDLRENRLTDIQALKGLTQLKSLGLERTLVADLQALKGLTHLKELFLDNTLVADIQPLKGLTQLVVLLLSTTPVTDIQPLKGLTQLLVLHLHNTQVSDIQPLKGLTQLETLLLGNSPIADIQPLKGLTQLKTLYLANTLASDLQALKGLAQLKTLFLLGTPVADIEPLKGLTQLETLSLNNTQVADLQPLNALIAQGIEVKLSLYNGSKGIFIDNRPLNNPPLEIVKQGNKAILQYWAQLEAEKALREKNTKDISAAGIYENREVKLVLVGNGDAGKSALRHYLKTGEVSDDHDSTHGMETVIWEPDFEIGRLKAKKGATDGKIKVRVLDFGGQEYYHDTHHLFFSSNTAYLLLWSPQGNKLDEASVNRRIQGKISPTLQFNWPLQYWLGAIAHFCGDKARVQLDPDADLAAQRKLARARFDQAIASGQSLEDVELDFDRVNPEEIPYLLQHSSKKNLTAPAQVLVLQSKLDTEGIGFLQEAQLQQRFPLIYDFAAIGLSKAKPLRLAATKDLIHEMLEQMPIVGAIFPKSIGILKRAIERDKGPAEALTLQGFHRWANDVVKKATGVRKDYLSPEWIKVAVTYFAQIGLALYFPEAKLEALRDQIFLRPGLVTQRIYQILEGLAEKEGRFDRQHALKALITADKNDSAKKGHDYEGELASLLPVMQQFRIIFLEAGIQDKFIAPLYLPKVPLKAVQMFLGNKKKPIYRIQYPGFIHKSVVLHFFEEFGPEAYKEPTSNRSELFYFWREGIIVKKPDGEEMVLLEFYHGKEKDDAPGEYEAAHVDVIQLTESKNLGFVRAIKDTIDKINEGWGATVMVTANGHDFVDLKVLQRHAEAPKPQYVFADASGTQFQLRDFLPHITLHLPMKKVFISYSKADTSHLQNLENHLSVFKRNGIIDTWNCRQLIAGEKWDGKIKQELMDADIILFLVSADFLATDYIWDVEITKAIARDQDPNDAVKIVPIIVRACAWEDSPLGVFNSPLKAKVITSSSNIDEAWTDVVKSLKEIMHPDPNPR